MLTHSALAACRKAFDGACKSCRESQGSPVKSLIALDGALVVRVGSCGFMGTWILINKPGVAVR